MNGTLNGAIFTWGYQGSKPADLLDLCRRLAITHVIDCRARPMSRIPGFGGNQLKALFDGLPQVDADGTARPLYIQRGHSMGGVSASMTMPDDGPPALAPAVFDDLKFEVVERSCRLLLICQEHAPGDCHRHMTIALPLARMARDRPEWWPAGVEIRHVYEGELIEPLELQAAIDEDRDYDCEVLEDVAPSAEVAP